MFIIECYIYIGYIATELKKSIHDIQLLSTSIEQ